VTSAIVLASPISQGMLMLVLMPPPEDWHRSVRIDANAAPLRRQKGRASPAATLGENKGQIEF